MPQRQEYLKRQLARRSIAFQALDNGILSCAEPAAMRRLTQGLTANKIDGLLRRWLKRLPHPFSTGNPRVQDLLAALVAFRLLPDGFPNRDLRERVARLPGLIERIPHPHRHRVTDDGLKTALCYHRTHARVLRSAMSVAFDAPPRSAFRLQRAIDAFDRVIQRSWEGYGLAA